MSEIPILITDRLILRPFKLNDAAEVRRLAGDRSIADTTLNVPHPYEDGMAEKWISTHAETFAGRNGVTFAITHAPDDALVGAIGLMGMAKEGHQAELGYWVGRPFWARGYCTEAGRAVLRYAFSDLGLLRVHATHMTRNPASGRVMQKLGMRHEGTRRQHAKKWDKLEDVEIYGILKDDWIETTNNPGG